MHLLLLLPFLHLHDSYALSTATPKGFGTPKITRPEHSTDPSSAELMGRLASDWGSAAEIGILNGRRGLFATKKVAKEKVICKVPSDLALALSDPASDAAPTMTQCGTYYLEQYANEKTWEFYTTSLPSSTFTPMSFSDEEIDLLEFPPLVEAVRERKAAIGSDPRLQQATELVSSRSFSIAIADDGRDGEEDTMMDDRGQVMVKAGAQRSVRVLVPGLDMANHSGKAPNAKLTLIDPQKDNAWFALVATRNIPIGKEICLFYGAPTDELLLNYGVVEDNNPLDRYMLKKNQFDGWTTSMEEDQKMLEMIESSGEEEGNLSTVLKFRIQMKKSQLEE